MPKFGTIDASWSRPIAMAALLVLPLVVAVGVLLDLYSARRLRADWFPAARAVGESFAGPRSSASHP
jgi:hypothetical protein